VHFLPRSQNRKARHNTPPPFQEKDTAAGQIEKQFEIRQEIKL
jgi:hypothetical protein